jgi:hypothetical protein
MNPDGAPCEHPAHNAAYAADPRIARAEMWLCMLGGLMNMGMWLVRALRREAAPGANDPKWTGPGISFPDRCNPITIFGRLARAVRLAVALRLKIRQEIADLQAGKPLSAVRPASEATPADLAGVVEVEGPEDLEAPPECPRPEAPPRESRERRPESDRFYRLLNGPLKDAVAAICADFGLKPDWSLWTEDGFPPPPGGDVTAWDIFRSSETETPARPSGDDGVDGAAHIVWRPRWRQPRPPRKKPPLDPRCDRGPNTWRDFNDFYYNDVLKDGEVDPR